jgi:hypothetical protein
MKKMVASNSRDEYQMFPKERDFGGESDKYLGRRS